MFFTILHWDLGKDLGVSGDFFFESKVSASKTQCYGSGVRATTLTLREEVH